MNRVERPLTTKTLGLFVLGLALSSFAEEPASAQTGAAQGTWTFEFYLPDGSLYDTRTIVVDKPVSNYVVNSYGRRAVLKVDRRTDDFLFFEVTRLPYGFTEFLAVGTVDLTSSPARVTGVWEFGFRYWYRVELLLGGYFIGTKQ